MKAIKAADTDQVVLAHFSKVRTLTMAGIGALLLLLDILASFYHPLRRGKAFMAVFS
jgi:hypothetical protein